MAIIIYIKTINKCTLEIIEIYLSFSLIFSPIDIISDIIDTVRSLHLRSQEKKTHFIE